MAWCGSKGRGPYIGPKTRAHMVIHAIGLFVKSKGLKVNNHVTSFQTVRFTRPGVDFLRLIVFIIAVDINRGFTTIESFRNTGDIMDAETEENNVSGTVR